jgi:uncharacterized protein YqgC (DUF456 family)
VAGRARLGPAPNEEIRVPAPVVVLVLVAMLLGLLGTVLPAVPGLPLIWGAALASYLTVGFDGVAWLTMVLLSAQLVAGIVAKYVLPARQGGHTAPRRSLLWGAAGAVVGFFAVPVVGFAIGGVGGLYLAELRRTGNGDHARRTTVVALKRFGLGVLVEIAAGLSMILVWLMSVVLAA